MASILVHVSEEQRRVLNSEQVCYAQIQADGVLVFGPQGQPLRDTRKVGAIEASWGKLGLVRIAEDCLINPDKVQVIRRQPGRDRLWELEMAQPAGTVLAIERKYLPGLWTAYGER